MTTEKKLKASVYTDAKGICNEVGHEHGMEFEQSAAELIGELTWKKLLLYGNDLEAFHKHAKRSAVTIDDVKLLCRRNASLKAFIDQECPSTSKGTSTGAKRKRKVPTVITLD